MAKRLNLGARREKRTEINPSRNDITGDRLLSKPVDNTYEEGYERIFGKPEPPKEKDTSWVWRPEE